MAEGRKIRGYGKMRNKYNEKKQYYEKEFGDRGTTAKGITAWNRRGRANKPRYGGVLGAASGLWGWPV